jgi:hypothetical protein
VTEASPAPPKSATEKPADRRPNTIKIPPEIERLLNEAIKRGVDDALQASGGKLSPPREQEIVQRVSRDVTIEFQRTILASYEGPIPPPHMLAEFDRVVPGLSSQIVGMAISEQRHRHRWENKALWNDIFMQSGGLTLGWGLAGASLLGAFVLGMAGKTVEMAILLSVPVIQMIRSIINSGQPGQKQNPQSPQAARRSGSMPLPVANIRGARIARIVKWAPPGMPQQRYGKILITLGLFCFKPDAYGSGQPSRPLPASPPARYPD